MEYAAALAEKSAQQEGRILELEGVLNNCTTVTLPSELAAAATVSTATTSPAATEMAAMRTQIQALTTHITTLATKSTTDGGSRSSGRKGGGARLDGSFETPGTHKCVNCKKWVKHKDANCLELEANAAKRFPGWVSRLK